MKRRQPEKKQRAFREKIRKKNDEARKEFVVQVLRAGSYRSGKSSKIRFTEVRLTDPEMNHSAIFSYRYALGLSDIAYIVNPQHGGLALNAKESIIFNIESEDEKAKFKADHSTETGWVWDREMIDAKNPWVPMSDFEIRAVKYLNRFPPIDSSVRMQDGKKE